MYDKNALDFSEKVFLLSEAKVAFLVEVLHFVSKRLEQESSFQRQLDLQVKDRLEQ